MPSSIARPLAVVSLACVAALLFGYTLGFTSPALLPMELSAASAVFGTETVSDGVISSSDAASFGALANIGAMLGALLAGPLSDGAGRKSAIAVCAALFVAGWFSLGAASAASDVLGSSMGVWAIFGARLLTGVGLGTASGTVPVYIAEIAPAAIRGTLGVLNQLGIVSGIFLVYAIGYARQRPERSTVSCMVNPLGDEGGPTGCQRVASIGWSCIGPDASPSATDPVMLTGTGAGDPRAGWCVGQMARWVELTSIAGAIAVWLLFSAWLLLPETPAYLRTQGRAAEALAVEAWLLGATAPTTTPAPTTTAPPSKAGAAVLPRPSSPAGPPPPPDAPPDAAPDAEGAGYGRLGCLWTAIGCVSRRQSKPHDDAEKSASGTLSPTDGRTERAEPPELSLCSPSVRAPLRISISLMAIQQFSGGTAQDRTPDHLTSQPKKLSTSSGVRSHAVQSMR